MEAALVERAVAAATSIAREAAVAVDDVVILQSSNTLTVRIVPCDVVARVAVGRADAAAFELTLAEGLAARDAPVARIDGRLERRVHERDGFAMTFWTSYDDVSSPRLAPAAYADALRRLHTAMRDLDVETPHVTDRIAEAERLVADRQASPALADADRDLLVHTLREARRTIVGRTEQLLHGEPHPGNVLNASDGPVFIDLETCCRGPVEFDVAHVPDEVAGRYPGLDPLLVGECRRLVLALVAAWRWDARDDFPDGRRHGEAIVGLLRAGPPWPALGALTSR